MTHKKTLTAAAVAILAVAAMNTVAVAATPEEAAQLKTTLTPYGAERAGNKDGSIPAWTGGYTKIPAGYKPGELRADPFASEKPVVTITGKNADQYADQLSEATKFLLKKYPEFRVDVYPTHRSAAAPQWVYDNIFKNATRVKSDAQAGAMPEGGYGGIPYPFAKTGDEHLWNHRLTWKGGAYTQTWFTWVMTADGKRVLSQRTKSTDSWAYYADPKGTPETFDGIFFRSLGETLAPASKAGEGILIMDTLDFDKRAAWQYLVGQRRVRKLPTLGYDTPDILTSGTVMWDENYMLGGPLDRHEVKVLGKREMFIPYNSNKTLLAKNDDLVKPNFLNPDHVRWERHRVWVLEATLKAGQRHVVPKRRYYIDEDTRAIVMQDGWDAQGQLWRGGFNFPILAPEIPAVLTTAPFALYNLQTSAYVYHGHNEGNDFFKPVPTPPNSFFTPDELANQGGR